MKKIVVTFDKRGGSKIEAFGFTGSGCLQATKDIEEAIGKAENRKMKSGGDTVEATQTASQS
jgi:hypothetical protein